MLGNWVAFDCYNLGLHNQGQISGINPREGSIEPTTFNICFKQDGKDAVFLGCSRRNVKPIPLSVDILKRNGFKLIDGDEYRYFEADGDSYYFGYSSIHYYLKSGIVHLAREYKGGSQWCITKVIKYVHELQQAIKFCGIEKEINL